MNYLMIPLCVSFTRMEWLVLCAKLSMAESDHLFFASGKAIFCQNAQPRVENKSSHIFQKLQVTYNKIVRTTFWRQYFMHNARCVYFRMR